MLIQMDRQMVRGAQALLAANGKPIECMVGLMEAFIVGASFGQLTCQNGTRQAVIETEHVRVEEEVAEQLRAAYESVASSARAAVQFATGAGSARGQYSAGKLGFRQR